MSKPWNLIDEVCDNDFENVYTAYAVFDGVIATFGTGVGDGWATLSSPRQARGDGRGYGTEDGCGHLLNFKR